MSWPRVLIFAVLSAVLGAAVLMIPFIRTTSLANFGALPEGWLVLALVVALNCARPLEAGLKTLVFFLVSQPLIYLFQIIVGFNTWELFRFYPYWFGLSLLCFPAAIVAWFVKKENILSAVILSAGTSMLALLGVYFVENCFAYMAYSQTCFPKHSLSAVFCFASAGILIFALLSKPRERIITGAVTVLATAAGVLLALNGML